MSKEEGGFHCSSVSPKSLWVAHINYSRTAHRTVVHTAQSHTFSPFPSWRVKSLRRLWKKQQSKPTEFTTVTYILHLFFLKKSLQKKTHLLSASLQRCPPSTPRVFSRPTWTRKSRKAELTGGRLWPTMGGDSKGMRLLLSSVTPSSSPLPLSTLQTHPFFFLQKHLPSLP